jgi:hypothetical protein
MHNVHLNQRACAPRRETVSLDAEDDAERSGKSRKTATNSNVELREGVELIGRLPGQREALLQAQSSN